MGRPAARVVRRERAHLRTRLRRALGCGEGERRIVTAGGGYLLRVGPDERDLDRFDALATRGREALAAGDPQRAEADLAGALALWRGPALAGLTLPGRSCVRCPRWRNGGS
ncbi:BTAD domain-containing putative transcriptional regulator [Luedemannella flava]